MSQTFLRQEYSTSRFWRQRWLPRKIRQCLSFSLKKSTSTCCTKFCKNPKYHSKNYEVFFRKSPKNTFWDFVVHDSALALGILIYTNSLTEIQNSFFLEVLYISKCFSKMFEVNYSNKEFGCIWRKLYRYVSLLSTNKDTNVRRPWFHFYVFSLIPSLSLKYEIYKIKMKKKSTKNKRTSEHVCPLVRSWG